MPPEPVKPAPNAGPATPAPSSALPKVTIPPMTVTPMMKPPPAPAAPTPSPVVAPIMPPAPPPPVLQKPVATPVVPPPVPQAPQPMPKLPLKDDIDKILKDVKLPERREFPNTAAKPARVIENTFAPAPADSTPVAKAAAPAATSAAAPAPTAPSAPANPNVGTVHTLKDDLQHVVREKKISLVRAAALEEDKRRGQERVTPIPSPAALRQKRRTRAILFSATMLFVVGALALAGVYYVQTQQSPAPNLAQGSSILFSEQTVAFPIGNQNPRDLKRLLAQTRTASGGSLGSITRIVPTVTTTNQDGTTSQSPATLQQFFTALGIQPPDALLRAVGPDFFFGVHTVDTNAPIFVIPVTSYDHAFAGMLQWEANMDADLTPIFPAVPALTLGKDGLPAARTFVDDVMRNYDVRELKDDQGTVQLYYSFPTPTLLVVAESTYSFTEILSRLQAERKL
jgi:hypothetical protein